MNNIMVITAEGISSLVSSIINNLVTSDYVKGIQDHINSEADRSILADESLAASIDEIRIDLQTSIASAINTIIDPINNPISEESVSTTVTVELEIGGISRKDGIIYDAKDRVRTKDFVPVTSGISYQFTNLNAYKICVFCYDANKQILLWNNPYVYQYINNEGVLVIPSSASYIKFYSSDTSDPLIEFRMTSSDINKVYAKFKSQYFSDGEYMLSCNEFDPGLWELQLTGIKDEFSIFTIRAPEISKEATIALKCWNKDVRQFADFSCMKYDKDSPGQVCIICQKRGDITPLPYFFIGFNDGGSAKRVQKFRIEPDAIPMYLTNAGIRVRRNNTYNNNWLEEETVTINLAELSDKVYDIDKTISDDIIPRQCDNVDKQNHFTCIYPDGYDQQNTIVIGNKAFVADPSNVDNKLIMSFQLTKVIYESNHIYCEFSGADPANVESISLYIKKVNPIG